MQLKSHVTLKSNLLQYRFLFNGKSQVNKYADDFETEN